MDSYIAETLAALERNAFNPETPTGGCKPSGYDMEARSSGLA
jgi:hypothetical protein